MTLTVTPIFLIINGILILFVFNILAVKTSWRAKLLIPDFYGFLLLIVGFIWLAYDQNSELNNSHVNISVSGDFPEIVKAFAQLAWPFAVIFIACIFRGELIGLFRKISKITTGQTTVEFDQNEPQNIPTIPPATGQIVLTPYIAEHAAKIREAVRLTEESIRQEELIKFAALNVAGMEFEHAYGLIFGSQQNAIRYLYANNVASDLKIFYEQHVERMALEGATSGTFVQWVMFIVNQGLIAPAQQKDTFIITNKGKEFLDFINSRNYPNRRL